MEGPIWSGPVQITVNGSSGFDLSKLDFFAPINSVAGMGLTLPWIYEQIQKRRKRRALAKVSSNRRRRGEHGKHAERERQRRKRMIVVTSEHVTDQRIVETKGQVFGLVVRSRGLGGNIMAGLRSLGGGEIIEYTQMLEEARRHALDRMVQNATAMGARDHHDALRFFGTGPDDERDRGLRDGCGDRARIVRLPCFVLL